MLNFLSKYLGVFLIVGAVLSFANDSEAAPAFAHSIPVDPSNWSGDPYRTGKRVTLSSGSVSIVGGSITLWYTANNGNLIPSGTFAPGTHDGIQTGALVLTYDSGNNPPGNATLYYN